MHRQISHIDPAFRQESQAGLYLFTGLIAVLIGLDVLWPSLAGWLGPQLGLDLPTFANGFSLFGFQVRFALVAAILGVVRSLDTLVAGKLGADLALGVAVVAAIAINQPLVGAEVVLIGLVGECLEAFTFSRTQRAIGRLVEVCPRMCLVLRDGQEVKTRVEDVRVGERVLVRPGKRVSVDGVVVEGRSAVDESTLTGESLPAEKSLGDEVFAGTLNQHGALVVEARRVAEHTVMGRVLEMTARALKDKAPLERTADRLARYFLPVVGALAAITFLVNWWWYGGTREALYSAVYPALSVLVVACPCALILATPAAVVAALGRLAGTGALLKGGAAIERLAAVNAFAFDKTGTLTEGRLQLGDVVPLGEGLSPDALLQVAATAEQRSEHLLGQLLVKAAREKNLELAAVDDFLAHPGAGVVARSGSDTFIVGSRRFLEEQGVAVTPRAESVLACLDDAGQTSLLVAQNGQILGIIGARDHVRPEAGAVLRDLEALGIARTALLTGDRTAPAHNVASELGLMEVHAELLPAQKAEFIDRWRQQGQNVAMVGDGINDAPALAKANVGLALGGVGADVAAEAGDFVLMGDPLRPLPLLVRLSRKTVEIIRQNIIFFAFGVNAIGILLTAWVMPAWSESARHQSPIWAAIYHQIGSLAVLLNAMRLLGFERGRSLAVVRGYQAASRRLDYWIEHASFHEFSHWLEQRQRRVLGSAAALLFLLYVASGLTVVQADQVGIVRRFGRPLAEDLTPGLHWRWPWPWERVTKVEPDRLRSVEVGFRVLDSQTLAALTWTSTHDGATRHQEEALMMTGDGNLLEVQASIFYTIADPRTYVFNVATPDETLRALAESVLREAVAEHAFLDLLASGREEFQELVTARLRERCSREYALGIALQSVAVQDLHPPRNVVDAYYEVTRALSQKDRMVIEARREKETGISHAEVARRRTKAEAEGRYLAATATTAAERDAFLSLAVAQRWGWLSGFVVPTPAAPQPFDLALSLRRLEQQHAGNGLPQELVEFRLHVETAEQILAGRPKVLRDPAVKGQLHIMPELLKLRLPPLGRDPEFRAPRAPRDGNEER